MDPAIDIAALAHTRESWHVVAEHVVAAALYRASGRIGLRSTPGGFGTPEFSTGHGRRQVRVDGTTIMVSDDGVERSAPLTTVGVAARLVGIEPGMDPTVYSPSTVVDPETPLVVDEPSTRVLAAWFALGEHVLAGIRMGAGTDDAPSDVVLWPEHFDLGLEIGDEATGSRGTLGASPGDHEHPLPYLYVTHWSNEPTDPRWRDPFWNDLTFGGASRSLAMLATDPDPRSDGSTRAREFYRAGRQIMRGPRSD